MDGEFWQLLLDTLEQLEKDPTIRGVIFSSGLSRDVFTAGNDIKELYGPLTTKAKFTRFWTAQTKFLARLYKTPLVTIAAIRGACPAGGCIVSLNCDTRIMTDDPSSCIGLNEVALGIAVPKYWVEVMATIVGKRCTQKLCLTAAMPKSREALALGLVDEVVPKADLLPAAEKAMKHLLRLPSSGYGVTKFALNGALADAWEAQIPQEVETVYGILNAEATVKALGAVLQRLNNNKAKL